MGPVVITLLVLFLFLRDVRAVSVVAIAVPVSLLVAGAFLFLGGYTLNLITMLGLVVGIGMLVDNSIVVFEAVQRGLERGLSADVAAIAGIRRTVRAIVAASATNAVVFLPPMFLVEDSLVRGSLELIAQHRLDRLDDRGSHHDHPGASAVGTVVDRSVAIGRPIPDVVNLDCSTAI